MSCYSTTFGPERIHSICLTKGKQRFSLNMTSYAVTGCPLPPWVVMAFYSHSQDIEELEGDWHPTTLLTPINGKLYTGAQEL